MFHTLTLAILVGTSPQLTDTTITGNQLRPASLRQTVPATVAAAPVRRVAPVALASAAPLPASTTAPQVVQLRGVVRYPDGKPCAGASVYPAGSMRQLVITDAQGNFMLPVAAGSGLILKVEYFSVGSSRVEIPAPSATPLAITLGQ